VCVWWWLATGMVWGSRQGAGHIGASQHTHTRHWHARTKTRTSKSSSSSLP
jgi:hypothetical protein